MFSSALSVSIFLVIALILGNAVWQHRPIYLRLVFGCVALVLGFFGFWTVMTLVRDVFLLMFFFQIGFGWVAALLALVVGVVALVKWIKAPPSRPGQSPRNRVRTVETHRDRYPDAGK